MPTITKQEIQRHYRKDLVENFEKLGKLHKLKNIEAYSLPVMTENEIAQEVEGKISEMTKHVCELDYSYCQDVPTTSSVVTKQAARMIRTLDGGKFNLASNIPLCHKRLGLIAWRSRKNIVSLQYV